MEGAMLKAILGNKSVPRVGIDQRVRDARLRLERIERLLVPRAAMTASRLRRTLGLFSFGLYGEARRGNRTKGPLSHRRPSRMSKIQEDWIEVCGSCCG
jgi:hypothetical protein